MKRILFFDADNDLREFVQECPIKGYEYVFFDEPFYFISPKKLEEYTESEIISVFTHSTTIPNEKLDLFPNLKLIATRSTGVNHIDLDYCKKRGITVANVPQYGAITVAEFAFALLLSLVRKIPRASADMRRADVQLPLYTGIDLAGKTIGVIGTGSIGRHIIQLAEGFGMNVLAYDLYPNPELKKLYVKSLDELYEASDVISLNVPSTPENYHLLNKQAFAKMKKGVYIINTARGDLINAEALYQAIRKGKVAGAGLDVMENEDFLLHDETETAVNSHNSDFLLTSAINLKLLQCPNVIATPHIAFNSYDAIRRINATTCENIRAFLGGKPINSR
ncbi:MAG: NAD(P)-dependent oxidoreductase [Alphaproteobacteria bacterium]